MQVDISGQGLLMFPMDGQRRKGWQEEDRTD